MPGETAPLYNDLPFPFMESLPFISPLPLPLDLPLPLPLEDEDLPLPLGLSFLTYSSSMNCSVCCAEYGLSASPSKSGRSFSPFLIMMLA